MTEGSQGARAGVDPIRVLIADDHAGYVLGCDGNRAAETPNLDRLASAGAARPDAASTLSKSRFVRAWRSWDFSGTASMIVLKLN